MAELKLLQRVLGPVMTNCYILIDKYNKEAVIIDPADRADVLDKLLKEEGAELKAMLLTHAHFDHVSAVPELRKMYPDAEVIIGEGDQELLGNAMQNLSAVMGDSPVTFAPDRTVSDGETMEVLGHTVKCIEVPGHTKGGMCYYFEDLKVIFDGDTLFRGSVGRSDFPTGDEEALLRSISEKLFSLPDDTVVFPGHNEQTTIATEKKYNFYF